jgi:hypothetical protein
MAERKGKKLRRVAKLKTYYATGPMRIATNKKRRMRKHIRSHPMDRQAVKTYEFVKNFGHADGFGLTSKGKKRRLRWERANLPRVAVP